MQLRFDGPDLVAQAGGPLEVEVFRRLPHVQFQVGELRGQAVAVVAHVVAEQQHPAADEGGDPTDRIDPGAMPLTRAANSAIEKVAPQFAAVADMLAEYGGTDLLSYRADHPEVLATRQAAEWDPLIDWAAVALKAPLRITEGVIPVPQDPAALARLRDRLDRLTPWQLTALHDLVTLPGSLILGLAVLEGRIDAATAHRLARLDEDYQAEQWGRDDEAEAAAAARLDAMRVAERLLALLVPAV